MILFSSLKLEKAIAEGEITGWQKAKYIIIPAVFMAPFASTTFLISPKFQTRPPGFHTLIQFVCTIGTMVITYYGIKFCFKANNKIDNHNFIERFCILLLPVTLQLILIFFPLTLLITGINYAIYRHQQDILTKYSIMYVIFGPIYTVIYYSLLLRSFRRLGKLLEKDSSYFFDSPVDLTE